MSEEQIILSKEQIYDFKSWVNINIDSVTWQGRYDENFNKFWNDFFIPDLSLSQIIERFEFSKENINVGPLNSWFDWLEERFICFTFFKLNVSILNLSYQSKIEISEVAFILRSFFCEKLPEHQIIWNELFHIRNITSENINLTFDQICNQMDIDKNSFNVSSVNIMENLEVTLYEEWNKYIKVMQKNLLTKSIDLKKMRKNATFKKQFDFIKEFVFLSVIGIVLIQGLIFVNKYYESTLLDSINILAGIKESDKPLLFKKQANIKINPRLNPKEFEEIEKINKLDNLTSYSSGPLEKESDVIITSLDNSPKDFGATDYEKSEYEENLRGEYRDFRSGRWKVYRIMIRTTESGRVNDDLEKLIKQFEAEPVKKNVRKLSKRVPGGYSYNLLVPSKALKKFLNQIRENEDSSVYEHRSKKMNPQGFNKVFVWIQNI